MTTTIRTEKNVVMPDRAPRPSNAAEFRLEKRRAVRFRAAVIIVTAVSWFYRMLPQGLRYPATDLVSKLSYRRSTTYRNNVHANMRQVLGPQATEQQIENVAREVFRTNGRNFGDLLMTPHMAQEGFLHTEPLVTGSWKTLDNALAAGRGVVILTAHLGPFDYLGQVIHQRGYQLTVVTGRTTARMLFDAVTHLRRSQDMRLVEASPSGLRRIVQALRRNECAVILADRDFFQNGKKVNFFGAETTLPPGTVRLARDTGAAIVPVFAFRSRLGNQLWIDDAVHVEKTSDVEADIARGMDQITALLQRAIAARPEQWVMFQRVWPSEPVDPLRVFPVGSPLAGEFLKRVDELLPAPSPASTEPAPGE